jgi:hypothetical protein
MLEIMVESMFETAAVVVVVMVVLVLAGRSFYRTITGKKKGECCGCDSCPCGDVKNVKKQD